MKAVITGAGSGLGAEFARQLEKSGWHTVLSARSEDRLKDIASELKNAEIFPCDLSKEEDCKALFEKHSDADLIINNAGVGVFGIFSENSLNDELAMLDVNIRGLHILTKLYINEFVKKDKGCVVNVASSASFFPGPLFSAYYASKAYVFRLTEGIYQELKKSGSNVKISLLCPGPVDTEFNKKMGVQAGFGAKSPEFVVRIALKNMGKRIIVPGFFIKCTRFFSKLMPDRLSAKINYKLQMGKMKNV